MPDGPAPRRVYIDLGANWANTLRLYEDISEKTWLQGGPWEVYAFEASPFIQPYLEDFVNFLNGDGPQPALKVPPSGSSDHLNRYAPKYGCAVAPPWDEMRECMFERFKEQLHALKPDALLGDRSLVDRRLQAASRIPSSTRFVHVPAAAGSQDGKLDLGMMVPEQMIRGGALSRKIAGYPSASVNMVDVVTWMMKSFRKEDYVVVKMDIEGAEFPILTNLLDKNGGCLVDVLAMECHGQFGDCDALLDKLRSTKCMKLLLEPHDYRAFDNHSTPDLYFPVDPRL